MSSNFPKNHYFFMKLGQNVYFDDRNMIVLPFFSFFENFPISRFFPKNSNGKILGFSKLPTPRLLGPPRFTKVSKYTPLLLLFGPPFIRHCRQGHQRQKVDNAQFPMKTFLHGNIWIFKFQKIFDSFCPLLRKFSLKLNFLYLSRDQYTLKYRKNLCRENVPL